MKKNPIFWGQWKMLIDEYRRIIIPTAIIEELRRAEVEELLCIPDGEYVRVFPWKKINEVPEEKMKDVWRATICESKPRITLPMDIRDSLFSDCNITILEGCRNYFKIIPLPTRVPTN